MDRLYLKSYYAPNLGKVLEIVVDNVKSDNISNTIYKIDSNYLYQR